MKWYLRLVQCLAVVVLMAAPKVVATAHAQTAWCTDSHNECASFGGYCDANDGLPSFDDIGPSAECALYGINADLYAASCWVDEGCDTWVNIWPEEPACWEYN